MLAWSTELATPSVNVLPTVSVGVEGGFCPYQPSAYASVSPAVTDDVYPSAHEAALQFDKDFDWAREAVVVPSVLHLKVCGSMVRDWAVFAETAGWDRQRASRTLNRLVAAGKLDVETTKRGRTKFRFYSRVMDA